MQFYVGKKQTVKKIDNNISFLDSMTMEPRNYARLQKRAEELRAVLLSKPASQKRDVIVDFFDRLFLADIKLHQAKNLLEEANGVGGNATNCVEKEVNRDIR